MPQRAESGCNAGQYDEGVTRTSCDAFSYVHASGDAFTTGCDCAASSTVIDRTKWRLTNAGALGWRPSVVVRFYSDAGCSSKIAIPAAGVTLSNFFSGKTYADFVDWSIGVTPSCGWRPGWPHEGARETWLEVEFAAPVDVLCADGSEMGFSTNYEKCIHRCDSHGVRGCSEEGLRTMHWTLSD